MNGNLFLSTPILFPSGGKKQFNFDNILKNNKLEINKGFLSSPLLTCFSCIR